MADIESAYAALGRKTLELEQMHAEYDRLLALLDGVLTGEIAPQRVRVDLEGRSWVLDAIPDATTYDAAMNGSSKTNAGKG